MRNHVRSAITAAITIISMLFSMVPSAAAAGPTPVGYVSGRELTAEVMESYQTLSPEGQKLFLAFMAQESTMGRPELLHYHLRTVGTVPSGAVSNTGPAITDALQRTSTIQALGALSTLASDLRALSLPTPVYYSLMATGSGLAAAVGDGPLPIGDIIAVITGIGSVAILAFYWDTVSPKWDSIVQVFGRAFRSAYQSVTAAFDTLLIRVLAAEIPSSLLKDKQTVDLGKFTEKVKGRTAYKNPKTGWEIDKDTANHGGREWKLKDARGNRKASLGPDGKILGK